jgi:hypothetical protein
VTLFILKQSFRQQPQRPYAYAAKVLLVPYMVPCLGWREFTFRAEGRRVVQERLEEVLCGVADVADDLLRPRTPGDMAKHIAIGRTSSMHGLSVRQAW